METLQDFVSARFGDLTAATGLTDWARHALNAVTSAASSVRATPVTAVRCVTADGPHRYRAATCGSSAPASSAADLDGISNCRRLTNSRCAPVSGSSNSMRCASSRSGVEIAGGNVNDVGIQRVTLDRYPQRRHVHPQLVGAPGARRQPVQPVR